MSLAHIFESLVIDRRSVLLSIILRGAVHIHDATLNVIVTLTFQPTHPRLLTSRVAIVNKVVRKHFQTRDLIILK